MWFDISVTASSYRSVRSIKKIQISRSRQKSIKSQIILITVSKRRHHHFMGAESEKNTYVATVQSKEKKLSGGLSLIFNYYRPFVQNRGIYQDVCLSIKN